MTTSTSVPESTDTTTGESTGGPPMMAHSCAELLEMDPGARTGVHTLFDDEGAPYEAYCLMGFEGGGWTLVGRSELDAEDTPFGWRSERGSVNDTNDAYSLGAWGKGLGFTEILVADREDGEFVPFERAYIIVMPLGFVEESESATVATVSVTTVLGDCDPPGGPSMMSYMGYTGRDDTFFVRDHMGDGGFGLRASRWALAHDNCNQGGRLNDTQGVMFVR